MIAAADHHAGRIVQVIGSTFDAEFEEGHLPEIYNALRVDTDVQGVHIRLTGEVQQHLGGNRVRCVALGSTDGLVRGMQVTDTGKSVQVTDNGEPLWILHPANGTETDDAERRRLIEEFKRKNG